MNVAPATIIAEAEALLSSHKAVEASTLLDQALAADPADAEALHLKALSAASLGNYCEAIGGLDAALELRQEPAWFRDLGALLYATGQIRDAIAAFQKALHYGGENAELLAFSGHALLEARLPLRALRLYERALSLAPDDPALMRSRGLALLALQRHEAAIRCLTRACELEPQCAAGHGWLASAYGRSLRYDLALRHRKRAAALAKTDIKATKGVCFGLWSTGPVEDCLALGDSLLAAGVSDPAFHFSYLSALDHFTPHATQSRQAWETWGIQHRKAPLPSPVLDRDLTPGRILRIGYLVDEIHRVPDCHFIPPLLENRDRTRFSTFCYLTMSLARDYPKRLSGLVENTRDLRARPTEEIADRIAQDRIDILVNVSWAQRHTHLLVFSHRPAPIQVELPHYPATTGLPEADCILSDGWICPPGNESMYRERVCRLRASYMPWRPPASAPAVSPAPMEQKGSCTFGVFQKPVKLNRTTWDVFSEILRRVPGSRLLIHQRSRDLDDAGSDSRARYTLEMSNRGIDARRLLFAGARGPLAHYRTVARADIALDTFPYNGTTTTGDCLWMGVPVITLAGETHAGRVGLSMLSRMGLEEFAAASPEEYIAKAVRLAQDRPRVTHLRAELRPRMRASVLTDSRAVMAGIEEAYRVLWAEYCA